MDIEFLTEIFLHLFTQRIGCLKTDNSHPSSLMKCLLLVKNKINKFQDNLFHTDITDVIPRKIENIRNILWYRDDSEHRLVSLLQIRNHIQFFT